MITNQFSLGGAHGTYPVFDFNLEDNYDRPSVLSITTDAGMVDAISAETFMQFYFLDNLLFQGIPMYGKRNGDQFEVTLYDKIASLWTVGGFALAGGTAEFSYNNQSAYVIARDILNGSQFIASNTIPGTLVSVSGSWTTKPDLLFNIAKQVIDTNGNVATVWVDNKNYVYIGAMNADKTIDLSDRIVDATNQEINFIKFGGAIIQGGETSTGEKVLESSLSEQTYSDYHLDNRDLGNFLVINTPSDGKAKIAFNTVGNHKEIKIGFDKAGSAAASTWYAESIVNDIRSGNYYTNEVLLVDNDANFAYDELDMAFRIWFDADSNSRIDTWAPQTFFQDSPYSTYPQHAGLPYTYLKSMSVGFMDSSNKPLYEVTLEKYAAGIYGSKPSQYSTVYKTISDIGQIRIYVNQNNYNESIKMPNPSGAFVTPYSPAPYIIPYWTNKDYKFVFRFKSRANGWILQAAIENPWYMLTNSANMYTASCNSWDYVPKRWQLGGGSPWVNGDAGPQNGYPPIPTTPYLFSNINTFPDGTPANEVNGGGKPFIRFRVQTNIEKALINDAMYVSQVYGGNGKIPLVVGLPQKSVQHRPYLFHSDASIKHKTQAKAIARNVFNDYQKTVSADIDIDPMAYFYPTDVSKRFTIGWNVHLEEPSSIIGDYRIRAITATPDRVTVSLKNRNLALTDVLDKIQKQIKDVTNG